jgi:hypothetical protein
MRTALAVSMIALSALTIAAPPRSSASDAKAAPPSTSAAAITLSFKIDPRVLGPTYGGEHWVSPATYTGARAQGSVDTRARAVDAKGAPVHAEMEWKVSDPDLLTVSPPRGTRVTITARRAGTSTVTVMAGRASRTLTVKAEQPGGLWQLSVSQ